MAVLQATDARCAQRRVPARQESAGEARVAVQEEHVGQAQWPTSGNTNATKLGADEAKGAQNPRGARRGDPSKFPRRQTEGMLCSAVDCTTR